MSDYALRISDVEVGRYTLMAELAQADEAGLWERAGVVPGAVVADVGCGPGAVSAVLARVVGPQGRVVAVERDPAALETARQLLADVGAANVELRRGTASDTGIEPGSVDVVMVRHVLAHNGPDEQRIVDHLATLVRPGGSVYLVDADGSAMRLRGADPVVEELSERYVELHRRRGNDLLTGLRLDQLLVRARLELVHYQGSYDVLRPPAGFRTPAWAAREALVAEGLATPKDLVRWEGAFARTDALAERPTVFVPKFIALGRRA